MSGWYTWKRHRDGQEERVQVDRCHHRIIFKERRTIAAEAYRSLFPFYSFSISRFPSLSLKLSPLFFSLSLLMSCLSCLRSLADAKGDVDIPLSQIGAHIQRELGNLKGDPFDTSIQPPTSARGGAPAVTSAPSSSNTLTVPNTKKEKRDRIKSEKKPPDLPRVPTVTPSVDVIFPSKLGLMDKKRIEVSSLWHLSVSPFHIYLSPPRVLTSFLRVPLSLASPHSCGRWWHPKHVSLSFSFSSSLFLSFSLSFFSFSSLLFSQCLDNHHAISFHHFHRFHCFFSDPFSLPQRWWQWMSRYPSSKRLGPKSTPFSPLRIAMQSTARGCTCCRKHSLTSLTLRKLPLLFWCTVWVTKSLRPFSSPSNNSN